MAYLTVGRQDPVGAWAVGHHLAVEVEEAPVEVWTVGKAPVEARAVAAGTPVEAWTVVAASPVPQSFLTELEMTAGVTRVAGLLAVESQARAKEREKVKLLRGEETS